MAIITDMNPAGTSIPCSEEVRRRVKAEKRGGETYDELLQKMVEQYEPKNEC
jgi:hypothetical protein